MGDRVRISYVGQSRQESENMRYSTYQLPNYTNIIPFYRVFYYYYNYYYY